MPFTTPNVDPNDVEPFGLIRHNLLFYKDPRPGATYEDHTKWNDYYHKHAQAPKIDVNGNPIFDKPNNKTKSNSPSQQEDLQGYGKKSKTSMASILSSIISFLSGEGFGGEPVSTENDSKYIEKKPVINTQKPTMPPDPFPRTTQVPPDDNWIGWDA